uniref:Myb-like domain-containing protein n=1 Tax=Brassica oleracea var. oleracea TaxID=109376 RepID=A0A0D3AV16_BRAOL
MDFNPFQDSAKFVELLNSQQKVVFGSQGSASRSSSQVPFFSQGTEEGRDLPAERKERRAWTPTDDIVLISSWLNTSKDPVVGNEQKSVAFWTRVATYFSASPKISGSEKREGPQCKQRWHKLNEAVCKFCGAYEAATREKNSGMNENDVVKLAQEIFFNNYKKKFTLEHAWKELRHDQKWCEEVRGWKSLASSQVPENPAAVDVDGTSRPPGVKASKARGKNPQAEEKRLSDFQSLWSIKQNDLAMKERLSKLRILENLLAKDPPLADYEEVIMKELINELIETPTYPEIFFRRRFRMNKPLFLHIVDRISNEVQYFRKKKDGLGRISLSPLQNCTAAIRVLAYGSATDTVDEYLRLGETTTRRPTPAVLQRLLDVGKHRGFPGMVGSIDCMHWESKNCPTAWKGKYSRGSGTLNDINVLDRSPVFDDIIKGQAPNVTFLFNGREYHRAYYITDGIYPKWATFIQSIPLPQGPKAVLFAQRQEAVRKDVERAFGVLQARFAIVKNAALFWDKVKIGKIVRACIILHNMIVEDE